MSRVFNELPEINQIIISNLNIKDLLKITELSHEICNFINSQNYFQECQKFYQRLSNFPEKNIIFFNLGLMHQRIYVKYFIYACFANNKLIIEYLTEKYDLQNYYQEGFQKIFSSNNLIFIDWYYQKYGDKNFLANIDWNTVSSDISKNMTNFLLNLDKNLSNQIFIENNLKIAAYCGNLEFLEYLFSHKKYDSSFLQDIFLQICMKHYTNSIDWFLSHIKFEQKFLYQIRDIILNSFHQISYRLLIEKYYYIIVKLGDLPLNDYSNDNIILCYFYQYLTQDKLDELLDLLDILKETLQLDLILNASILSLIDEQDGLLDKILDYLDLDSGFLEKIISKSFNLHLIEYYDKKFGIKNLFNNLDSHILIQLFERKSIFRKYIMEKKLDGSCYLGDKPISMIININNLDLACMRGDLGAVKYLVRYFKYILNHIEFLNKSIIAGPNSACVLFLLDKNIISFEYIIENIIEKLTTETMCGYMDDLFPLVIEYCAHLDVNLPDLIDLNILFNLVCNYSCDFAKILYKYYGSYLNENLISSDLKTWLKIN